MSKVNSRPLKRRSLTKILATTQYNIPGIINSNKVTIVKGEECADGLIQQDIAATTVMCGTYEPISQTDWSILKGKHVTIWPEKDERYVKEVTAKLDKLNIPYEYLNI